MLTSIRELPGPAWAGVLRWTFIVVASCTILSILIAWFIFTGYGRPMSLRGLTVAVALPILIGTPMSLLHLIRLSQLRLANQQLQVLASTDWLTTCLNRRAFTNLVTDQLASGGAFLVIDADHFKFINDHFGHDRGDEVLQLLATTIKASVRENDVVGRIGGEEFGVLLRGANLEMARRVAERICDAVAEVGFAPEGTTHRLSVSVGGACFEGGISFSELFRIADQRLYRVKQTGRDHADVTIALDHSALKSTPTALAG